ncbi:MAG: amino acid permease [Acidimicrobiales bacterium]|nr:amino acid permease [Acidimicrobiales bacterium]
MKTPSRRSETKPSETTTSSSDAKLGTFGGVFIPSLLTILGLVLFLRLGFVVGNIGLLQMLAVLILATSVSMLTTISLAAIATNLRVGGGGVYFLISRTLGPAFGGAIGLVLYVAMSVSVAFYAIGLGEAVASVLSRDDTFTPQLVAAITVVGLTVLAWFGADIATKLQYLVLVFLTIAIVAYFVGVVPDLSFALARENLRPPVDGNGFWVSFAIFFPAITGFTQGVAMSGDLQTPSRSITVGTFSAIGVSTVVYLAVIVTFSMAVPLASLREDTAIMRSLAPLPALIDTGVIAATLSSAIASILGAPRTLQRLAADRLIPLLLPFEAGSGTDNNPRRGVLLTSAIALVTVAAGDLNLVAPIISMFFLASYGMINFATYSEARAASTSFRPTFRFFHWRLSLAGTLGCMGVILAIDPLAGAVAGIAVFSLYRYLRRSSERSRWVDSTRNYHAAEVRTHLKAMAPSHEPGRDWRPCTVAFASRDPLRREHLATMASWIEGGAGLSTMVRIVPGRGPVVRKQAARINLEIQQELAADGRGVFGRALVADTLEAGVASALQGLGIGEVRANLALFSGYADHGDGGGTDQSGYEILVQTGLRFGCNVAVLHGSPDAWARTPLPQSGDNTILVWWVDDRSGQLLVLLAWLVTRDSAWSRAAIRVHVASPHAEEGERVQRLLAEARLPATVVGIVNANDFLAVTADAQLVLAPLRVRTNSLLGPGDVPIVELSDRLPITLFVQPADEIELDLQPDDTNLSNLAMARERAQALTDRAKLLDTRAGELLVAAELARMTIGENKETAANGNTADTSPGPNELAASAYRDYVDARSRADEAWRLVDELDPTKNTEPVDPSLWVAARRGNKSIFHGPI